ncbi:DsrE family protein [Gemella morbillorum]|uniref:DsrE family protein n=1 Tax=Gemella morbillorum TaxID=29391 RepID=UPI00319E3CF0
MKKIDFLITLTAHENDANNVTIAFTMGLQAAQKGYDTVILLLSNAVALAEKGYADKIDIGEPFKPIKELLPAYLASGGRIAVCSACMKHNGVDEANVIDGVEVVTADFVIDGIMAAEKTLQLN